MDILILGSSNTGKTSLANFLATKSAFPVFNCDSVQIYKNLNSLTNKPKFSSQEIIDSEVISFLPKQDSLDFEKYQNLKFKIWIQKSKSEKIELIEIEQLNDLIKIVSNTLDSRLRGNDKQEGSKISNSVTQQLANSPTQNFLFDIRNPLESYSTFDFEKDLNRITEKFKFENKIIVGGTVYYAYNYLFQLNNDENYELEIINYESKKNLFKAENSQFSILNHQFNLDELKKLDPESLNLIDIKNPRRIQTALNFIKKFGKKYSENYLKENNLRENFILIEILPKDREEYYKSLDQIIDQRFSNPESFEEIKSLINDFGQEIIPWLEKVSYEYKYFLQIYFAKFKNQLESKPDFEKENLDIGEILQTLKYKEHQYAKRQITFLRRLENKFKQ